jgi:hypothetical protein
MPARGAFIDREEIIPRDTPLIADAVESPLLTPPLGRVISNDCGALKDILL